MRTASSAVALQLAGLWLMCISWMPAQAQETAGAAPIVLLPQEITITGPTSEQGLLVQEVLADGFGRQIREALEWTSANPEVAVVEQGVVRPVANGETTISVTTGRARAEAKVIVTGLDQPTTISFRNDVQPVLAKSGCNSGACHGALAGKGGFKLTLRGYDPNMDYFNITRQSRGRRIELADPGRSLMLAKPSGAMPHKGGLRFTTDSREYQILADWIAAGAPAPSADDPRVVALEILPDRALLIPGDNQQLLVQARYSDGRVVDVTRWVKFTSTDEAVAVVDENGQATVVGYGEGAVTAWFASHIVIARITSPYPNQVDPQIFAEAPRANFIDELVLKQLQRLHLPPSPPASDEEFIRRAYLDTIGMLPTAEEVRVFLADPGLDKRDRLIDHLLNRPEFVDYWTYKWSDVLLINGQLLRPEAVKAYYKWVRQQVEANTPWDQMVRSIVTSEGSSFENGATNFFALHQDPESMTENVAQAFLGLSIGCAKCHNHPL